MFRKLQIRLTLVCAVSTGLVLIGMAVASMHFATQQLQRQWEEAFESNLNSVFFYLRGQSAIDHTWLAQTEAAGSLYIRIESEGRPLFFTGQIRARDMLTREAANVALIDYGFDYKRPPSGTLQPDVIRFEFMPSLDLYMDPAEVGLYRYRAAVATVPVGGGSYMGVVILKDTYSEAVQIAQLQNVYALCVVIALVCLVIFAYFFSAWVIHPVKEGYRRQNEFVSAASHELRSPLAVMRASAGAIRGAPPDKATYFAHKIEDECERLGRLTSDLLQLTAADNRRMVLDMEATGPETLVLTAAERFEDLTAAKSIALEVQLPGRAMPPLHCDAARIDQLLGILLDNAVSYTPEGGQIRLRVSASHQQCVFSVADSGPGIPDEQKEKVFERFFRGDASRSKKEHYGLGLAIAKELVGLHRGSIRVGDSDMGGAEFFVTIPL